MKVACTNCHRPYPDEGVPYHCPHCSGLFDFIGVPTFDLQRVDFGLPGLWRYRHTFGLPKTAPQVFLGEGLTPLVGGVVDGHPIAYKMESTNPSGSFKDRGSAVLVSFLASRGVSQAVEDSSGNAGASFAAYSARAGIKCKIYIPESSSGPKRTQIEAYGAELVVVAGARSQASEAVRLAADSGTVYGSHAYLPFGIPGYATAAYEIVEQLGRSPGSVIVPAGQGNFLLGLAHGFKALLLAGVIGDLPRLIGVQARACAPLWMAFTHDQDDLSAVPEGETLAEGIRVRFPVRLQAVLQAVRDSKGWFVAVEEEKILAAKDELARQGFYVEPTSAVILPAIRQVIGLLPDPVVSILTGSGLKYRE